MPQEKESRPRLRNPRTRAFNQRDSVWQIGLPVGLAGLGVMALMVLVSSPAGAAGRSAYADVSLIFLLVPALVLGLVVLVLVGGLAVGVWFVRREVPYPLRRVQDVTELIAQHVQTLAGRIAGGVMSVHALWAAIRRALADVRAIFAGPGRSA